MHSASKTSSLLTRTRNAWHTGGASAVALGALHTAGCRTAGWFLRRLDAAEPPHAPLPAVEHRFLGADDHPLLTPLRGSPDEQCYRARLARGDWCAALSIDDRVVAVSWLTRHETWQEFLRVRIAVAAGTAYTYDTYVHPDVRGRRYHARLNAMLCRRAARHGARFAHSLIGLENRASLRAMRRLGYRRAGMILSLATFGERLCLCAGPGGWQAGRTLILRSPE